MTRRLLVVVVLLLLPLGCAEGQKPTPLKRSGPTASPPAERRVEDQKDKPPAPDEDKPKPQDKGPR
jgi:hypothetical protein